MNFKDNFQVKILFGFVVVAAIIFLLIFTKDNTKRETTTKNSSEIQASTALIAPKNGTQNKDEVSPEKQVLTNSELLKRLEELELKLSKLETQRIPLEKTVGSSKGITEPGLIKEEGYDVTTNMRSPVEIIDEVLLAETVDKDWSVSAVEELYKSLNKDTITGIEIKEAECRTTYCRMELNFNFDLVQEGFELLGTNLPWNGELFVHLEDEASGEAVVYLSREDYFLPNFSD